MLNVPERHFEYIATINSLTPIERDAIVELLSKAVAQECIDDLLASITPNVAFDRLKLQAVLAIAGSIINTASRFGKTREVLLNELQETLTNKSEEYSLSNDVREFILRVSENKVVCSTFKCEALKTDVSQSFENAKVITDLRPIFSEDGQSIYSTTVMSTLIIESFEGDRLSVNHFVLSDSDIDALIKILERAKVKSSVLKTFAAKGADNA